MGKLAGWTGLEPAAFRVTGGRYNQLNYHPARITKEVFLYWPWPLNSTTIFRTLALKGVLVKNLVISTILLTFSAAWSQSPNPETTYDLKMNTTCEACVKKITKNICEPFKSQLVECTPTVGALKLRGSNVDMAAIRKAIQKTGYEIESETTKPAAK